MTVEAKALSPVSDDRLLGTVFDRDNDALNSLFFITPGLLVFNISEVSSLTRSLSLLLRVIWDLWNFPPPRETCGTDHEGHLLIS